MEENHEQLIEVEKNTTKKCYASLVKVTPFSKFLALVLFISLPFIGFLLGLNYGYILTKDIQTIEVDVLSEPVTKEGTYTKTLDTQSNNEITYESQDDLITKLIALYKNSNQNKFVDEEQTYSLVNGAVTVKEKDGNLVWKSHENYYENINVHGDTIYAAVITKGGSDGLYAFDKHTGDVLWRKEIATEHIVIESVSDIDYIFVNDRGTVRVLLASSGEELWSFTKGIDGYSGIITPVRFIDNIVYVGSSDNNIYLLNKTDGTLMNQFTYAPEFPSDIYLADDYILILGRGVEVRNKDNHSLLYTINDLWVDYHSSIAVTDNVLYTLNYNNFDESLVAYSLVDGVEEWKTPLDYPQGSTLFVVADKVYIVVLTLLDSIENIESYEINIFDKETGVFIETVNTETSF